MCLSMEFVEITRMSSNASSDSFENIDTSRYPFPNTLWHVKPAKEIAIKTTAMLLVGLLGIFLNSVILTILIRNKWLWTPSNYLIGNLALVDFLTLLLCPWFMLVRDFFQNYVLRQFGCRFEGFMQATLLLAGVGAVMLVSYDRLAAATLTTEARVTKKVAPKLIIATWVTASALSIPWIVKREYQERPWLDFLELLCAEDIYFLDIYWHFILLLLVWIPLGVMVLTYGVIMWRLEISSRTLSNKGGGQAVRKMRGNAMRITACVLLTTAICRIPYTIMLYWRNNLSMEINAVDGGFSKLWFAASFFMYVNCAINPLIYGFTNTRFRQAMDRTPGVACFKFGSWCCVCGQVTNNKKLTPERNLKKIFIIEASPLPQKNLKRFINNIFHVNKDIVEFSMPKPDEVTTKPTKITPLKVEHFEGI